MSHAFRTAVVFLALSVGTSAQNAQRTSEQTAASRVAALSGLLDPDTGRSLTAAQWESEREKITSAIRAEVNNFVESSVQPSDKPAEIQARLRSVLAAHVPQLEYSDPPTARVADLRYGQSLVVAYTVVRPPHFDSTLIFGFREDAGRFRLVATAGADFDGYTMSTLELPSPYRGELWLLATGQAQTFNGARMRFRVYAFDGDGFRTSWSPDDVFGATVQITPQGFAITHSVREPPYKVTEEYTLTTNGPVRSR